MKAIAFKYTKSNDQVSERAMLAVSYPADYYEGIDISELDTEDAVKFVDRAKALQESFKLDLARLVEEYDLKHNYRRFIPSKMENISEF